MRWKRLTKRQKQKLKADANMKWHRKFAWWPTVDPKSQLVYWMEYVWMRAHKLRDDYNVWADDWEVRGGQECPEIKTCPDGMIPSVVLPDAAKHIDIPLPPGVSVR